MSVEKLPRLKMLRRLLSGDSINWLIYLVTAIRVVTVGHLKHHLLHPSLLFSCYHPTTTNQSSAEVIRRGPIFQDTPAIRATFKPDHQTNNQHAHFECFGARARCSRAVVSYRPFYQHDFSRKSCKFNCERVSDIMCDHALGVNIK